MYQAGFSRMLRWIAGGVTVPFYTGADLPHKIGETVDSARFFDRYFGALAR